MKSNINHPLKGKFIKVLTKEHGAKVIIWFRIQGVNTAYYQGAASESDGEDYIYYGINRHGTFIRYPLDIVEAEKYEIIELPTELTFPRKMLTWDDDYRLRRERIVLFHNTLGNPSVPYITVADGYKKRYENNLPYEIMSWKNAEELPTTPIIEEMTLIDVCKALGKDIKIIK